MWALFAVTPLAQVMVVWLQPAPRTLMIGYVIPLVMAGGLVFTFGMLLLISRAQRPDVTRFEKAARRLFFKQSPSR